MLIFLLGQSRAFLLQIRWPIRLINLRIHHLVLKIQPYPFILPAIKSPAGHWPMRMNRATFLLAVPMLTATVRAPGDEIRRGKIPAHDAFFHILLRERKTQFATGGVAQVNPIFAADWDFALELVFVVLRFLIHHAHAALGEFFHQIGGNLLFAPIQLGEIEQAFLIEQINRRIEERGDFQKLAGIRVGEKMRVAQAFGHLMAVGDAIAGLAIHF
ncbi:MAG: hypothetical protein ONB48_12010 [candidate division KSB1 bacterium]|nr:hypothetical protein [candidate division KSB1 bacterium]MDZ7286369.1 hypothetical protein [candidate division KSB1 bacterium]MDZ7347463.1 hypothetical protein [candidate division KSB1 bacterium]MDZ7351767.1 hypothetical protein [candidate division KSB1 bacterium]MDZ7380427.1 hypothetical protein [candidate division KSB1 bacterium]